MNQSDAIRDLWLHAIQVQRVREVARHQYSSECTVIAAIVTRVASDWKPIPWEGGKELRFQRCDCLRQRLRLDLQLERRKNYFVRCGNGLSLGDFFSGCIVWGISGIHTNSDDFPWKNKQKSIIISTNGRNTRIMMDFCGFFQGKSSEFAWLPEIPYTMHPLKKSPSEGILAKNSIRGAIRYGCRSYRAGFYTPPPPHPWKYPPRGGGCIKGGGV